MRLRNSWPCQGQKRNFVFSVANVSTFRSLPAVGSIVLFSGSGCYTHRQLIPTDILMLTGNATIGILVFFMMVVRLDGRRSKSSELDLYLKLIPNYKLCWLTERNGQIIYS